MLTYRAMFKFLPDGVHAEVLDFPGAISCASSLDEARQMLRSALVDLAETTLQRSESLPPPNPLATDPDSDLEEPIYLLLSAASSVRVMAQDTTS